MRSSGFRVGVIGAGWSAEQHVMGWKQNPHVEVVAVADVALHRAEALAVKERIPQVLDDPHKLLDLELDAVSVCIPNRAHAPVVIAALEAGKHVICEKPLATSTAEVRQMGERADATGLKLMTAQNRRYLNVSQALRSWVDEGRLGSVYHARVKTMRRAFVPIGPGFIDKTLSGGGPCMDTGVHVLDVCLWLMGFPDPVRVTGATRVNFAKGHKLPGLWGEWDRALFSVEDFASGFIHFASGATMTFEASWLGHQLDKEDSSCELFGTESFVRWPSGDFATVQGRNFVTGTIASAQREHGPFADELHAFYEAVVQDRPSPVPWTESLRVTAILEAIYASQESGAEVTLDR